MTFLKLVEKNSENNRVRRLLKTAPEAGKSTRGAIAPFAPMPGYGLHRLRRSKRDARQIDLRPLFQLPAGRGFSRPFGSRVPLERDCLLSGSRLSLIGRYGPGGRLLGVYS